MLLSEFLAQYPDVDREAGQELADIAALVETLDRTGRFVLEVKVAKSNQFVLVTVGHQGKPPKGDAHAGLFFVGPDGLTKDDPHQGRFDPVAGVIHPAPHARED